MEASLKDKFEAIVGRNYAGQARWFLNGYWKDHEKDAEAIWEFVQLAILIDHRRGKEGNELDELEAHRFLEKLGETLTVADMRKKLKEIDIDFNKRMALIEYLIFKYNKPVKDVINAHQGDPLQKQKLDAAEKLVAQANIALDELSQRLEEEKQALAYRRVAEQNARKAEADARAAEADASDRAADAAQSEAAAVAREAAAKDRELTAREEEVKAREAEADAVARETVAKERAVSARQREATARDAEDNATARADEAKRADDENKQALDALHAQEKEFSDKKNELDAKSKDESLGQVARGKAKNELEQLKTTDPLPLQRAKINQAATVRKSEKAHEIAETARVAAAAAREEASKARDVAENAREAAEAARAHAEKQRLDAEAARSSAERAREAAEKARAEATAAREAADHAKDEATKAALAAAAMRAEQEKKAAEAQLAVEATAIAREDAERRVAEASAALEVLKSMPDQSYGDIWWMERELYERKRYLPKSKQ